MSLSLFAAPTLAPVTLQETKDHLRVTHDLDDALISVLIEAAVQNLDGRDGWLGRALMAQTWDYTLDAFPSGMSIPLPLAPVQSITAITYTDADGAAGTTFDSGSYAMGEDLAWSPRVWLGYGLTWPSTRGVPDAAKIRFVAGYATRHDVPAPIKAAILLMIGHLYENREATAETRLIEVPMASQYLLAPYRRHLV